MKLSRGSLVCFSGRMFDCLQAGSALPRYMCNIVQKEMEENKWTIVSSERNASKTNPIIKHQSPHILLTLNLLFQETKIENRLLRSAVNVYLYI